MKFMKLLIPAAICVGSTVIGSENGAFKNAKNFLSSLDSHTYCSYEINQLGFTQPSLGCKTEWKNLVFDASVGGKYLSLGNTTLKTLNVSTKLLYKFFKKESFHLYGGIGTDQLVNFYKSKRAKREWWKKHKISERNCYFSPSVVIGNQVKINDKRSIFFEFIYKPYIFGSNSSKRIHEDSFRIGLMY